MPHRYKVREIAQQSGLSEATVDRVLNDRPGVRENTRAEVAQAIADLDKQRAQLRLNGRRYLIDVVMQTPQRFSDAFRAAIEAELPAFAPAMLRARFHLWESGSTAQMVDALGRIRGSHGVVLKAQDEPEVAEAVDRLVGAGVPVVTYTTDVPNSARCAYVGIDNHGAGVTAAYLMDQWLGDRAVGRADHAQPARRSAARVSARSASGPRCADPAARSSRSATATASTPPPSDWCSTRCERHPGGRGRLLSRRRQHRDGRRVREDRDGSAGSSSPTTSMPTTAGCCATAGSRWCCTTICAPTPGWRCGRSCSTTAPCPPSRRGRRRSR